MDVFMFAVNAVMPIILLILLGFFLKKIGFLKEDFLKKANTFVFKVCLPCLLFINVYQIESFETIDWTVVLYSEIAIIVIFLLGMILVKFTVKDNKKKGVILQCVFRSNFAIIGLPLAESLGGATGRGVAAVLSAFSIPTFNILAVIALSIYVKEEGEKINFKDVLKKIVTNPLIIGVVLGLIVLGIRSLIPVHDGVLSFSFSTNTYTKFLYKSIENISKIGSPFALIILGGLFNFNAVKGMLKEILIGTLSRIVVVPFAVIAIAIVLSKTTSFFNFDQTIYPSLIALFGSPVAVSSAIMAESMDNDGELAGQLVVWTSIGSIVTIFLSVVILRGMGLL